MCDSRTGVAALGAAVIGDCKKPVKIHKKCIFSLLGLLPYHIELVPCIMPMYYAVVVDTWYGAIPYHQRVVSHRYGGTYHQLVVSRRSLSKHASNAMVIPTIVWWSHHHHHMVP